MRLINNLTNEKNEKKKKYQFQWINILKPFMAIGQWMEKTELEVEYVFRL